jgi:hypothetical protein
MAHRLKIPEGKKLSALRKQTPEPVFDIIKSVMGFGQFSMRGLEKVRGEWSLVTMSWNLKRMFALMPARDGRSARPHSQRLASTSPKIASAPAPAAAQPVRPVAGDMPLVATRLNTSVRRVASKLHQRADWNAKCFDGPRSAELR